MPPEALFPGLAREVVYMMRKELVKQTGVP